MKKQGNRTAGVMMIIISIVAITILAIMTLIFRNAMSEAGTPLPWALNMPLLVGSVFILIPLISGIVTLVNGVKYRKLMQTGRKSVCKVYNVMRVKNGYEMIISYRGDSGMEYKQSIPIKQTDAALIKPDMWVECYIGGENCYVDEYHIAIKDAPETFE